MNKEYMTILLQSSHTESGRGIVIHSSKWQDKGQVHPARQWVTLFMNLDLCHLSAPFLPSLMQGIRSFKSTDLIQSPLRKTLPWGLLVGQSAPGLQSSAGPFPIIVWALTTAPHFFNLAFPQRPASFQTEFSWLVVVFPLCCESVPSFW